MLSATNYAQNYAGIIGKALLSSPYTSLLSTYPNLEVHRVYKVYKRNDE